ncbi:hypothetical protein AVEN_42676-1 [Araneus ventricosus]|uniref:Uncharacterized protein n=1 Tax=Araneus ventricosus TaxID=182803 RepID=A0A4Y2BMP6_ARAVE|nr:hypothetical protein AVEN_42676-1 [Araneus ventricosus]
MEFFCSKKPGSTSKKKRLEAWTRREAWTYRLKETPGSIGPAVNLRSPKGTSLEEVDHLSMNPGSTRWEPWKHPFVTLESLEPAGTRRHRHGAAQQRRRNRLETVEQSLLQVESTMR